MKLGKSDLVKGEKARGTFLNEERKEGSKEGAESKQVFPVYQTPDAIEL